MDGINAIESTPVGICATEWILTLPCDRCDRTVLYSEYHPEASTAFGRALSDILEGSGSSGGRPGALYLNNII